MMLTTCVAASTLCPRRQRIVVLLASLIILCLCPWLAIPGLAQLPRSFISQGGFEATLDGWEKAEGTATIDETERHSGKASVRLTGPASLQTPLIPYSQEFVHVVIWMKTQDVERGPEAWNKAGAQVSWYDEDKKPLRHADIGLTEGTKGWTKHEGHYYWEEKEQVAFFRVTLMLWNARGTAWFDDVVVEATEPPEPFRKVPLLKEVENNPPRIWPLPELQAAPGPIDVGPMKVNFSSKQDFIVRPADEAAPEITRINVRIGGFRGQLGRTESGLESVAGYYYRYKSLAEAESGYPALEVYDEVFRGSPILSQFMRVYLTNESRIGRFEVSFRVPQGLDRLTYFEGDTLQTGRLGEIEPILQSKTTTKPFIVLHRGDDAAGLVIYFPVPAEIRRWHVEDYVVEARPDIVCKVREEDGKQLIYWRFDDIRTGPGGYEHSFDLTMFLMPYAGALHEALQEFQVGNVDLTASEPPLGLDLPRGYWTAWMPSGGPGRLLRMSRYHPREFASWISGMSGCYGHRNGRMWGGMTQQMKGIRVDPLAERALARDHAFRMLTFFVERANDHGAPPDLMTWRTVAARLPNPEDYYNHVFCQYWEYRVAEFRRLMRSPLLTDPEKEDIYLRLQLAKNVFDPDRPGSWTEVLPNGGYWFKYMDLPIWPENQWVINTHTTSVGVAGQFCWLAKETGHDEDVEWWGEIFKRGVDGLLYALGQDWMWYVGQHDENELRYARARGGPRGYHTYMMTAWLPEVIRSALAMDGYRVDELLAYEQRLMKAKFLQRDERALKLAAEFLKSIEEEMP